MPCGFKGAGICSNFELHAISKLHLVRPPQVLLVRGLVVTALCVLANTWRGAHAIPWHDAVTIWWAGGMRGAVTIGLAYHHFVGKQDEYVSFSSFLHCEMQTPS